MIKSFFKGVRFLVSPKALLGVVIALEVPSPFSCMSTTNKSLLGPSFPSMRVITARKFSTESFATTIFCTTDSSQAATGSLEIFDRLQRLSYFYHFFTNEGVPARLDAMHTSGFYARETRATQVSGSADKSMLRSSSPLTLLKLELAKYEGNISPRYRHTRTSLRSPSIASMKTCTARRL